MEERGNRGGVRMIYYSVEDEVSNTPYVYANDEQGDLTPAQIKTVARLVREEFK